MTYEEIKNIRKELRSTNGFEEDKAFLLEVIFEYRDVPREKTYELSDLFIKYADERNWSRRKLDTLIEDLLFKTRELGGFSDDIDDLLSNFLDWLEGNCIGAARLNGDPLDDEDLKIYVCKGDWWQQDFYSTEKI